MSGAPVSLSLVLVQVGAGQYEGAFGPGLGALAPDPVSMGAPDLVSDFNNAVYALDGHLNFGGLGFEGEASSDLVQGTAAPFQLTGSGAGGTVSATCQSDSEQALAPVEGAVPLAVAPLVSLLSCTGSVDGGPVATAHILLVLPVQQTY